MSLLASTAGVEVSQLVAFKAERVCRAIDTYPSFFDIKRQPWRTAAADLLAAGRTVSAHLRAGDVMIVEKRDIRYAFLKRFRRDVRMISPQKTTNAYRDRARMFERLTGRAPSLPDCSRPSPGVRAVAINPDAREDFKALPPDLIGWLVEYFERRGIGVRLIDPSGRCKAVQPQCERYLAGATLERAAALLQTADLYIGPDSFFMHLAYFYGKPVFRFTHAAGGYFVPPGCERNGAHFSLERHRDHRHLAAVLDANIPA